MFRKWHDTTLDEAISMMQSAGLTDTAGGRELVSEMQRRAEIRLTRAEYGATHEASWYDPRPIVHEPIAAGEPSCEIPELEKRALWGDR